MTSLKSILDQQLEKLNKIKTITTILKGRRNVKEELKDLHNEYVQIEQLQNEVVMEYEETKNLILKVHSLLPILNEKEKLWNKLNNDSEAKRCLETINRQKDRSEIIARPVANAQSGPNEHETNRSGQKSVNGNENGYRKENGIFIRPLSSDEFQSIPKYIIGRNTVSALNSFVTTLNEILEEKYSFLAEGRIKAKKKNKIDKFLHYKAQETIVKEAPKGNDVYFFNEEDYKNFTQSKLDKIKLNFLTALRHVKRIEFIRISKDIYYSIDKR